MEDETKTRDETARTYKVNGMSCEHCVASVREEVGEVEGVSAVEVDLASGRLVVEGAASPEQVRAAVELAGYELATTAGS